MKKTLLTYILLCIPIFVSAQKLNVRIENRDSWISKTDAGSSTYDYSRFSEDRLCLIANGTITDGLTFSIRQHLDRPVSANDILSATDWIYLQYRIDEHWQINGGKNMLEVGGIEYYENPSDIYFSGEYFNNYHCFTYGAAVGYWLDGGHDLISFQVSRSPFAYLQDNLLSYNMSWRATHGIYEAAWSANMFECPGKELMAHIALGNKITYGPASLAFDLIERWNPQDFKPFGDFSMMTQARYKIGNYLSAFVKLCVDTNQSNLIDRQVLCGTDVMVAGAGLEFFPYKGSDRMRIHFVFDKTFGTMAYGGVIVPDVSRINIGITVKPNIINL